MNWNQYKNDFFHYAKYNGKSQEYVDVCLTYAKRLFEQNIPIIYDQYHLSLLVGYKLEYLIKVSNSSKHFYRSFQVPKHGNNEFRLISEPLPNLKDIQKWILNSILNQLEPSPYSKAFRKGYSIKDNAKFHKGQKKVLTMDIKNYFGSIKYSNVYSFFRELSYTKSVAVMLSNICTLNDALPQGSPTSPMLANLITRNLDKRIAKYAIKNKIRYTRYADDITMSGDFDVGTVIRVVKSISKSEGFKINDGKTRVRTQNQQQEVTGIVVNEKLQAPRKYRRDLRQNIYYIEKHGFQSHVDFIGAKDKIAYLYTLIGMANFIININPLDEEAIENYNYLKELLYKVKKG